MSNEDLNPRRAEFSLGSCVTLLCHSGHSVPVYSPCKVVFVRNKVKLGSSCRGGVPHEQELGLSWHCLGSCSSQGTQSHWRQGGTERDLEFGLFQVPSLLKSKFNSSYDCSEMMPSPTLPDLLQTVRNTLTFLLPLLLSGATAGNLE